MPKFIILIRDAEGDLEPAVTSQGRAGGDLKIEEYDSKEEAEEAAENHPLCEPHNYQIVGLEI